MTQAQPASRPFVSDDDLAASHAGTRGAPGAAGERAGVAPAGRGGDPAGAGRPAEGKGPRGMVAVLAFAGISVAVMQTLVVPIVTELPQLLHTATSNAAWVITATLLSGAVATPIMGRLGDLYGKRRMILASLGLMVIGSLVCGFTSSLIPMVAGRALQGFAMGAIPLGISIMRDELPREQLGSAMAFMSSSLGVGGALGMPLAAYVAQEVDWHVLFFGAAGLGALAMALVLVSVPESAFRSPGRFDVLGSVGLTAGLVALLLAISKGSDWGWGSATTLGLLGASVVVFLLWGVLELRLKDPLVDLRTTARRQVLLTNLASITVGLAFYAVTLVLPQLIQLPSATGYGLGRSMVVAGLCVAPMGVAMMLVSSLSARLSAARGPKVSLMSGLVVLAVAYLAGTQLMGGVWQVVVTSVLIGIGIGIAYSAMPALIISAVDPSESGAANGLNTLMRSIGTSTSSAVIGVVLAHMTTPLGGRPVPDLDGFRTSFLIAAGAALLGLFIAAFLPGRTRAGAAPSTVPEPVPAGAAVPEPVPAGAPAAAQAPAAQPAPQVTLPVRPRPTGPGHPAVHGTVRDPQGRPLPGAVVALLSHGGRRLDRASAGPDGTYEVRPPKAGDYVLLASAGGHLPEARPLTVVARTAAASLRVHRDITLSAAAGVRGAIRERGGRPLGGVKVSLRAADGRTVATQTTAKNGGYAFGGLRGGTYTLVAHGEDAAGGDGTVAAPLTVDGSGQVHHDLYLGRPGD